MGSWACLKYEEVGSRKLALLFVFVQVCLWFSSMFVFVQVCLCLFEFVRACLRLFVFVQFFSLVLLKIVVCFFIFLGFFNHILFVCSLFVFRACQACVLFSSQTFHTRYR